jgi:hypothetical protein
MPSFRYICSVVSYRLVLCSVNDSYCVMVVGPAIGLGLSYRLVS